MSILETCQGPEKMEDNLSPLKMKDDLNEKNNATKND
jgi:hypothetical protein